MQIIVKKVKKKGKILYFFNINRDIEFAPGKIRKK